MKKGFTLVELLAVVAILSLLVIIALPNIMALFNEAKKNSFLTECKQIYKTAQQQWMNDSMFNTDDQVYKRCATCTGKSLSLSGRNQIEYYVKVNKAGKVVKMYVTDGTYQFVRDTELEITDITDAVQISTLTEEEIITISNNPSSTKEICIIDMIGAANSQRFFIPFKEGVTWSQYYASADQSTKNTLDSLWNDHTEYKTNFITSKCFLVDGQSEQMCYTLSQQYSGPYDGYDFENNNVYGDLGPDHTVMDSSKICYTYID